MQSEADKPYLKVLSYVWSTVDVTFPQLYPIAFAILARQQSQLLQASELINEDRLTLTHEGVVWTAIRTDGDRILFRNNEQYSCFMLIDMRYALTVSSGGLRCPVLTFGRINDDQGLSMEVNRRRYELQEVFAFAYLLSQMPGL